MVYLRKCSNFDIIEWLDEQCFPADYRIEEDSETTWIVGYADGIPVCYIGVQDIGQGVGFVPRIGVLESHQGQRLARRLLKRITKESKEIGLAQLVTYIAHNNPQSLNCFFADGYKALIPEYLYAGKEFIYMVKNLGDM